MFYNVIKDFSDVIAAYSVTKFEKFGSAASLVAQIELNDHSSLHIKDYLFVDGTRKYAYHWQDATGQVRMRRMRWDNSPTISRLQHFPTTNISSLITSWRLKSEAYGMCWQ